METGDAAAGSMERLVVEESAGSVARRPVSGRLIGDCGLSPKPGGCRLEPARRSAASYRKLDLF
jgi:hypothetical protein